MKTKLLFPIMIFICAVGMAFSSVHSDNQTLDYILKNGTWKAIPEQSCNPGDYTCQVRLGEGGQVFDVYDEMNQNTLKESDSPIPTVINP